MTRISANARRKEILELLSVVRTTTYGELAVRFGVSRRTVMRDIQILISVDYIPIMSVSGRNGGGIKVVDGWYLSRHYLKPDQETCLEGLLSRCNDEEKAIVQEILRCFSSPKRMG